MWIWVWAFHRFIECHHTHRHSIGRVTFFAFSIYSCSGFCNSSELFLSLQELFSHLNDFFFFISYQSWRGGKGWWERHRKREKRKKKALNERAWRHWIFNFELLHVAFEMSSWIFIKKTTKTKLLLWCRWPVNLEFFFSSWGNIKLWKIITNSGFCDAKSYTKSGEGILSQSILIANLVNYRKNSPITSST